MLAFAVVLLYLQTPPTAPPATAGAVKISPALAVDRVNGFVFVDAEVVQREVALELLLCPRRGAREHESILAADVAPRDVHLALLLAGAIPGRPVQTDPFVPPSGQRIKIWVEQETKDGKTLVDAREWIRSEGTKRTLQADFVFAGSSMVQAPGSDRVVYLADEGYIVCVANFPHAIVDVDVKSTDKEAQGLAFVPFTDRIPAKGAKVRVVFEPVVD